MEPVEGAIAEPLSVCAYCQELLLSVRSQKESRCNVFSQFEHLTVRNAPENIGY